MDNLDWQREKYHSCQRRHITKTSSDVNYAYKTIKKITFYSLIGTEHELHFSSSNKLE